MVFWLILTTRAMLEAIIISGARYWASSRLSLRAAAKSGWAILSTGSSGKIKSAGNFSQMISGLVLNLAAEGFTIACVIGLG